MPAMDSDAEISLGTGGSAALQSRRHSPGGLCLQAPPSFERRQRHEALIVSTGLPH